MKTASFIAKGGLFTALSFICIYASSIVPTNKLFLLGAASCIIPISILATNLKNSVLVYIATSLLGLLVLGVKGTVIGYILFFGIYGFAKLYIERFQKLYLEIFIKLLFFNAAFLFIMLLYRLFFFTLPKVQLSIYLVFIMMQFVFLAYDYALTVFISYFNTHWLSKLK